MFRRHRFFKPIGDDRYELLLKTDEREVISLICNDIAFTIENDDGHEYLRRVFPIAHVDDAELNASYYELVHADLVDSRLTILRSVAGSVLDSEIDSEMLRQWVMAFTTVRLFLGTRLDVSEDEPRVLDPDDPLVAYRVIYEFLGAVQSVAVDLLSRRL